MKAKKACCLSLGVITLVMKMGIFFFFFLMLVYGQVKIK